VAEVALDEFVELVELVLLVTGGIGRIKRNVDV